MVSAFNVVMWGYLVYVFWGEQFHRGHGGFFPLVAIMVFGFLMLNVGVFVIRGLYVVQAFGWVPSLSEKFITVLAQGLQTFMGICMFVVGLAMVVVIIRRKRGDL